MNLSQPRTSAQDLSILSATKKLQMNQKAIEG
jgi:hypothetical protein